MTQVTIIEKAYNKYQVPQVDNRTRGGYKMLTALRNVYGETVLDGTKVTADGRRVEIFVNTYELTWGEVNPTRTNAVARDVEAMRAEVAAKVARVNRNA